MWRSVCTEDRTLTAGQRNDITQAGNLTKDVQNTTVIGDKGYDSSAFVESLENNGYKIVIPPKSNRKVQREYDQHTYKERHLIECLLVKSNILGVYFLGLIKLQPPF